VQQRNTRGKRCDETAFTLQIAELLQSFAQFAREQSRYNRAATVSIIGTGQVSLYLQPLIAVQFFLPESQLLANLFALEEIFFAKSQNRHTGSATPAKAKVGLRLALHISFAVPP